MLDEIGVTITGKALETVDVLVKNDKERKRDWNVKDKKSQKSLATIFGEVKYERTYYVNKRTGEYKYLGDEVWSPTSTVANKTGQYNYVLDPKITDKVITDGTPAITTYTNQFVSSFSPTTNAWYAASVLSSNTYTDGSTTFTPIVYTKENTLDLENQVNGYTTGMIFEVQFTPGENLTVSQYNVTDDISIDGCKIDLINKEIDKINKKFDMANTND